VRNDVHLAPHSFSILTVIDIRFSALASKHESNQHRITRLAQKYDLPEVEIKLLIAADTDHIDSFGRMGA